MLNDDVHHKERMKRGMVEKAWVIVNNEPVLKSANVSEKSGPPLIEEKIERIYELKMPCAFGLAIESPSLGSKNFKKPHLIAEKEERK